jgi:hypothetical protein
MTDYRVTMNDDDGKALDALLRRPLLSLGMAGLTLEHVNQLSALRFRLKAARALAQIEETPDDA